ncbi:MAG: ParB-like protein [Candidatus Babeliales bacterium]
MNHKYLLLLIFFSCFDWILSEETILKKDMKKYISITELSPGQLRFTRKNVATKAKKLMQTKGQFDNAKSSLSIQDAIPIILGPNGLKILVDSHHECLAAQQNKDITVPVRVIDDLSNLDTQEFFKTALERNYIYPFDRMKRLVLMPMEGWYTWDQMQDDPNRLFASITAWKYKNPEEGTKDPNASEDPEYPLWVKKLWKKVELAFIEFKIASVLYEAGLEYDYKWGVNPNSEKLLEFTEKARAVLADALNKEQISSFDLIPTKRKRKEINQNYGNIGRYSYQ